MGQTRKSLFVVWCCSPFRQNRLSQMCYQSNAFYSDKKAIYTHNTDNYYDYNENAEFYFNN